METNDEYSRNPLGLPRHYSMFSGMFTPHYPGDFDYENFYDNFFGWHKSKPNNDEHHHYHYNNHKPTTEATTTEQFTDSTTSTKVPELFPQSPEEDTIKDNNESHKKEIDDSSKENAKIIDETPIREDENHKDNEKPEGSDASDKLSKSTDHVVAPLNIGQLDTIALPVGNIIVPAISIQSMNQVSPAFNPVASNNPAGNGYSAPSLVVHNNEAANANDDFRRSEPQAVPLTILQNPVNNNEQPNAYNIATISNNAVLNNIPNSYYLVSNTQGLPLNNGLQTQTSSQIYTLVPISNLGSNVITNQPANFVNQQLHINQPNNYLPLMSQPNYVTLSMSSQSTDFIPLNNQGNQYVSNQPNNLVRFNLPNNVNAVNNNQRNNMLTVSNQPNNFVVLNNQPNNMVAVNNNQPNNLIAFNSAGNIPFIVQPQLQPNIVLYSLKDKEENSDKKEEETEKKINDNDETHPREESIEVVDA